MKINIEGWSGLLQSYSIIAETYVKCLMTIPGIELYFTEKPYYIQTWEKTRSSLFDKLSSPPNKVDITIRFLYPYNYTPSPIATHTIVFATCEFDILSYVPDGPIKLDNNVWIMTPSQYSKNGIAKTGYPSDKIFVVSHCYEYDDINIPKNKLREKYKIPPDSFVFYHTGTMSQNKNVLHILMCFKELCKKYNHIYLLLKGMDKTFQSRNKVIGLINDIGDGEYINKIIYFGDDVDNTTMSEFYELSDCYISPFLAEGFNLPVLESLCHGINVICTKGGPPDEFAKDAMFIKSMIFPTANKILINGKTYFQNKITPDVTQFYDLMEFMIKTDIRFDDNITRRIAPKINKEYYRDKYSYKSIGNVFNNFLSIVISN